MLTTGQGSLTGLLILAHGGPVPADEFAVLALGVLLLLVCLSGVRRGGSRRGRGWTDSPGVPEAVADHDRTGGKVAENPDVERRGPGPGG